MNLIIQLKTSKLYARLLDTMKPVNAMISVKAGRPMVNHLLRIVDIIGIRKSLGLVKVIIVYLNFCFKYIQQSGISGLVIYLKACTVVLQQASGKHRLSSMNPLKVRFARTKSGYPRVIPILHRRRIHEPSVYRLWMTLFSLYRVLEVAGQLNLATITTPSSMDPSRLPDFASFLDKSFWVAVSNFGRFDDTKIGINWLEPWDFLKSLRATPFIISKSSSASGLIRIDKDDKTPLSTSPAGILAAVGAWMMNPMMYRVLTDWCKMTGNQWVINRIESWGKILLPMCAPNSPRYKYYKGMWTVLGQVYTRSLGRLGFKEEAAGKVRVFAMCDAFTQWVLKPLHDSLFELLSLFPQDGTTDQLAPVRELIRNNPKGPFFSYDLTAATDRIPIILQMAILSKLITAHGANLWSALLIGRGYDYIYNRKKGTVYYEAGQPMGALSSWAMLALTHHALVQYSSFRAGVTGPGEWFDNYAVLGDDLVIADAAVAEEYLRVMSEFGVGIGLAKSLISPDGLTLEFAKRTFHKGVDVSPVPFSEYWIGRQMLAASLELARKYNLTLPRYLSLFGFGYRAKGSATAPLMRLGQRLRHRVLAFFSPSGVNPLSPSVFFGMKGLNSFYAWSERKVSDLINEFVRAEAGRILERLESESMSKAVSFVKLLSTVNKDREYYGTLKRDAEGARKIDLYGLHPDRSSYAWSEQDPAVRFIDKDLYYFVVDDICQTVYREVYLDVLVELRELKYSLEDVMKVKKGQTLKDLDLVVQQYYEFQSALAEIPLPKEIFERVESEARVSNLGFIKQWEKYSKFARSTRSTFKRGHEVPLETTPTQV